MTYQRPTLEDHLAMAAELTTARDALAAVLMIATRHYPKNHPVYRKLEKEVCLDGRINAVRNLLDKDLYRCIPREEIPRYGSAYYCTRERLNEMEAK